MSTITKRYSRKPAKSILHKMDAYPSLVHQQQLMEKLQEHFAYIRKYGLDKPEIHTWKWERPHE